MKDQNQPEEQKCDAQVKIEKEIRFMTKVAYIGFPVLAVIVIVAPFIFTRAGAINLSQNGNIGANIGGITAPFIGLFSALLIFISFRAQIKANQIQIDALEEERNARKKSEKKNKIDDDLRFIYYRLEELQLIDSEKIIESFKKTYIFLVNLVRDNLLHDDAYIFIHQYQIATQKYKVQINFMKKYLDLYLIIQKKMKEIDFNEDHVQMEYINSIIKHEYQMYNIDNQRDKFKKEYDKLIIKKLNTSGELNKIMSLLENVFLFNKAIE